MRVTLSTHTHSFTWSRICVELSSAVFKISDQWSVNVSSNLRSEVHCMQSVICSLQSVVCSLQSAVCSLQSAVCSLQSAVCKCQTPWTRWVNWFTIYVHVSLLLKLYCYIRACKRTIACLFLCFNPLFSVVQLWNYTKTIIPLRLSEYCRINPSTSSRGLFDNIHFAFGE